MVYVRKSIVLLFSFFRTLIDP